MMTAAKRCLQREVRIQYIIAERKKVAKSIQLTKKV
jgi:hypothetical protein